MIHLIKMGTAVVVVVMSLSPPLELGEERTCPIPHVMGIIIDHETRCKSVWVGRGKFVGGLAERPRRRS